MGKREDDGMKGLGVTFKIGPGQKLMKDSMEGPLYVGPKKKAAPSPSAPKAKPKADMPKRPISPTPAPKGLPQRPISKTPEPKFNPLTSTYSYDGKTVVKAPARKEYPGPTPQSKDLEAFSPALGKKVPVYKASKPASESDSQPPAREPRMVFSPTLGRMVPAYKNGGQIRGDGMARVKTKGKMC